MDAQRPQQHSRLPLLLHYTMKPISLLDPNSGRVLRGGSWYTPSQFARVAYRHRWPPSDRYSYLGFRLASSVR